MKQVFLMLLLSSSLAVNAQQSMSFSYDDAGNRISRVMVLAKSRAKSNQAVSSQSLFDEVGGKQVQISPNTSMGHVLVEMLGKSDCAVNLSVYNASGMQVYSHPLQNGRLNVDLSSNPSGIYILTIEVDGERQSWKIVKK